MKNTELYIDRLLTPEAWKQTAQQLLAAAALIEPKIDEFWQRRNPPSATQSSWRPWDDEFVAIYFMLCAYAIENLLKARIIQKEPATIRADFAARQKLPQVLLGHDLYELTVKAGFHKLAVEEESLLRRLSRCSVWYGRYPLPLNPESLQSTHPTENYDFDISLTAYTSDDPRDIERIVNEIS